MWAAGLLDPLFVMRVGLLFGRDSRRAAFGVAREERGLADVVEAEVEEDDALEAEAAAGVRRRACKRVFFSPSWGEEQRPTTVSICNSVGV